MELAGNRVNEATDQENIVKDCQGEQDKIVDKTSKLAELRTEARHHGSQYKEENNSEVCVPLNLNTTMTSALVARISD